MPEEIKGNLSEQSRCRKVWGGMGALSKAGEGKCGVVWEHLRRKEIKGDLSEQSR